MSGKGPSRAGAVLSAKRLPKARDGRLLCPVARTDPALCGEFIEFKVKSQRPAVRASRVAWQHVARPELHLLLPAQPRELICRCDCLFQAGDEPVIALSIHA